MTKIRITFNVIVEYEASPENYPDGSTPEQMLAIDLANAEEDPFMLIDGGAWTTTAEVVDEAAAMAPEEAE